jgi:hypothetical protein
MRLVALHRLVLAMAGMVVFFASGLSTGLRGPGQ